MILLVILLVILLHSQNGMAEEHVLIKRKFLCVQYGMKRKTVSRQRISTSILETTGI